MAKLIRMVNCAYRGWIPMGRARTKCPGCGAVIQTKFPDGVHYVEEREA